METSLTDNAHQRPVKALAGFILYGLAIAITVAWILHARLIPWPFRRADTLGVTYLRILIYSPFAVLSVISICFLKMAGLRVRENIFWRRLSGSFFVGLFISIVYTAYLFMTNRFGLKGIEYIPPVILMSALNAVSEEFLFRLVLFQLLIPVTGSSGLSNGLQAFIYGLPHLFIGGPLFFAYAVVYGFILGWVAKTNSSVIPAVICHFAIDLGAIGLPLLIII